MKYRILKSDTVPACYKIQRRMWGMWFDHSEEDNPEGIYHNRQSVEKVLTIWSRKIRWSVDEKRGTGL